MNGLMDELMEGRGEERWWENGMTECRKEVHERSFVLYKSTQINLRLFIGIFWFKSHSPRQKGQNIRPQNATPITETYLTDAYLAFAETTTRLGETQR